MNEYIKTHQSPRETYLQWYEKWWRVETSKAILDISSPPTMMLVFLFHLVFLIKWPHRMRSNPVAYRLLGFLTTVFFSFWFASGGILFYNSIWCCNMFAHLFTTVPLAYNILHHYMLYAMLISSWDCYEQWMSINLVENTQHLPRVILRYTRLTK